MLLPFFQSLQDSNLGEAIRVSGWLFPVIEACHLVGLCVIGGTVLVVDLRLGGLGLRRQSAAELARDVQPWLIGSTVVMLLSGSLLFVSEAIKCYYSTAFWFKMTSLVLALLFTFTVRRRAAAAADNGVAPLSSRFVALASVALWSGVGIGGRWIGFS